MANQTRRIRPRTEIDAARQTAYDALRAVDTDDAYLNLTLPRMLAARGLGGRDAAFATELANGTARLRGSYDAVIDACVQAGAASLQPEVLTALRIGAHQLLGMRVASHAAVATSVELVRASVGERPVRLANAVLRRIGGRPLERWLDEVAPPRDDDLVGHLAVRHSHPEWIVSAFREALGCGNELETLLAADNVAPTVTLAARPGLLTVDQLVREGAVRGRWSPYAAGLPGGDPGALLQVRRGRAGVQDEGSQLAALALSRADVTGRDDRWLDLCAGPGGKAALLTGLARGRLATLVASDRAPHRARLALSALRGYPPPSAVLVADATRPAWGEAAFDRVIADVPCSGLGALRRRPESRWRRTPKDVAELVQLQAGLLNSALDSVREGGVVAYVTCSPHVAETRGVVDSVVGGRGDVREEDARALLPEVADLGAGPHVQLWPHRHGTDAIFVCSLRRS
ncbi:MAG: RsmB/NOP family class I SAM-dependent RNA methyltransferase [Nocardioidaceae bacterium]|nr:RsmB/NOP family class I SAM-dependent RNA methyltransferase [Nocardioidaceae bacterium]